MASDDLYRALLAEVERLREHLVGCASCSTCEATAGYHALRAVVELHAPVDDHGQPVCPICLVTIDHIDDAGRWTEDHRPAPAPCSTIRTIAEALGVQQDQKTHRGDGR